MFGSPYFCGLLPEQSYMMNRRSDSGKIRFRLDVKRTKSNRNADHDFADVLARGKDDPDSGLETKNRKISKFGSKYYEGEVQVQRNPLKGILHKC